MSRTPGCAPVTAGVAVRARAVCPTASSCPSWSRRWRRAADSVTHNDSCKPLEQQHLVERGQKRSAATAPLCWRPQPQQPQPFSRPPHLFDGARCQRLAHLSLRATRKTMPTLARERRDGRKLPMQRHAASPPPAAAAGCSAPLLSARCPHSPSLFLLLLHFPPSLPACICLRHGVEVDIRVCACGRVAEHGGGRKAEAAGGGCRG